MTDDILSELGRKKGEKWNTPTTGYQVIATMKEFKLSPLEWRRLSRFEKKALHYHRVMEQYYIDKHWQEVRKEQEREQKKHEFMSKLPRVKMPRRR